MYDTANGPEVPRFTYAVGDVHGRLDLVESVLARITSHAGGGSYRVVFLGDYIDRGPDSSAVVELLIQIQRDNDRVACLKGNHEDLMLQAITATEPATVRRWLRNGGAATLRSYGAEPEPGFQDAIPQKHIRWMAGLPLTTADPHRIFVHAGLLPRTTTHRQSEETLLWIREKFLQGAAGDFEAHVVHGHTPIWAGKPDPGAPELLGHRTNLDTAAFATGVLSVGVFDAEVPGGPVEVLKVVGAPAPHLASGLNEFAEDGAAEGPKRRRRKRFPPW